LVLIWTFKEIWNISLFLNFLRSFLHILEKFLWILNSICIAPLILILIFESIRFIDILIFFFFTVLFHLVFILVTLFATFYNWTLFVLVAYLQTFRGSIGSLVLVYVFAICKCRISLFLYWRFYIFFFFLRCLVHKCIFLFWCNYRYSSCYQLRAWSLFILFCSFSAFFIFIIIFGLNFGTFLVYYFWGFFFFIDNYISNLFDI
jgi:hypothetical protein